MRKATLILTCVLLALLAGCSSDQKSASSDAAGANKKQAEAPEYITGRSAFQKLFVAARGFSSDIQPYRLQSNYLASAPTTQGKAAIWRGYFASPARRESKAYTWSGVTADDLPERGVSHGTEDTWNPSSASAHVWDIPYLKVDSDKAFEVAEKHGGEKLTKKDPKQPVIFILDWDVHESRLLWHVIYGTSPSDAALRIAVDASTGEFVRNEH